MGLSAQKLAVIHIAKKELGLSEEMYREILRKAAGVESAKDLDEEGFRKLMRFMVRDKRYLISPGGLTLKQKLFIQHLARELGWDGEKLRGFILKYYHRTSLEALTKKEASKLIESLKNVRLHIRPSEDAP